MCVCACVCVCNWSFLFLPYIDCDVKCSTEALYNDHYQYQLLCPHPDCQLTFPTQKRLELHVAVAHDPSCHTGQCCDQCGFSALASCMRICVIVTVSFVDLVITFSACMQAWGLTWGSLICRTITKHCFTMSGTSNTVLVDVVTSRCCWMACYVPPLHAHTTSACTMSLCGQCVCAGHLLAF